MRELSNILVLSFIDFRFGVQGFHLGPGIFQMMSTCWDELPMSSSLPCSLNSKTDGIHRDHLEIMAVSFA